jgi:transcriptional regulator with XRE-family HTH domain|tara:strand:- start:9666 stop:10334 length:669 start_codon:yes stop_codon:yes gene_type:complete
MLISQIRAARGLLNWSQGQLAEEAHLSKASIQNYEIGKSTPNISSLNKMIKAFERAGVEFTEDGGVRPRQNQIMVLNGHEGMKTLFDDIFEVVRSHSNPDLCVSNVDEAAFDRWLGAPKSLQAQRSIGGARYNPRALIKDAGAQLTPGSYSEYRITAAECVADVSLYLYGDKAAFIESSAGGVKVTIMEGRDMIESLRKMFEAVWSISGVKVPAAAVTGCLF